MADVAASSTKKARRKARKNAAKVKSEVKPSATDHDPHQAAALQTSSPEGLEETLFWYNGGSDEKSQNMVALKLEVLGPFLFSYTSLCDEAVCLARKEGVLPEERLMWPTFFDKSWWSRITTLSHVMTAVTSLCEKDDDVYQLILSGTDLKGDSFFERLKAHCPGNRLKDTPSDQILLYYCLIQTQAADYGLRARGSETLAASFLRSLTDKVKLVDPVKDRGNSNFKQLRFRAAIADYSKAIKLCPFSPVLYCNRALCYLRNDDYWNACIDSYRALVLHPTWEKPYYRCAEAWHKLAEIQYALDVNQDGQFFCTSSSLLVAQLTTFTSEKTRIIKEEEDKVTSSSLKTESAKEEIRSKEPRKVPREKVAKDKVAGAQDKASVSSSSTPTPNQFTDFEALQCPEVDSRLSCAELRKLCNQVKLQWCSPASYLSAGPATPHRWEDLEPEWVEPTPPTTDILASREPMMAKFDEIWCPILADAEESLTIIPPTVQYFSDGTIMHSAVY